MNSTIKILTLLLVTSFFVTACQSEDEVLVQGTGGELTLSPLIDETNHSILRTIGSDFFQPGYGIDVSIQSSNAGSTEQKFLYTYGSDGIFRGNPGYRFTLDDNYITSLTAIWPSGATRGNGFVADQREIENYRLADWMNASTTLQGIVPTDKPVPLNFVRENTLLEFEITGQNLAGLNILALIVELQINGTATACRAHCEGGNHAKLIVPAGTQITSPDNYLIGRLTVEEGNDYTIIFPLTDLTLEAGKRYLVTLTPQGYFMDAYITIGDWAQTEDGIGIPFQPPVPDVNGNFTIETPLNLITMSYLMRHYTDGTTFDWPSRTYIIADDFTMTDELAALYIPVPSSLFTGQILQNGQPITSIEYGEGQTLELFDTTK